MKFTLPDGTEVVAFLNETINTWQVCLPAEHSGMLLMKAEQSHGGARPGSGRKKKGDTASISMRLNKEALDICRDYYKGKFSSKINDYVVKLAKKLVKDQ